MMNRWKVGLESPTARRVRRYGPSGMLVFALLALVLFYVGAGSFGTTSSVTVCDPVQAVPVTGPDAGHAAQAQHCHTTTNGTPTPKWVTGVFIGLVGFFVLALAVTLIQLVRTPPGFVRLAEAITTLVLALSAGGLAFVLVLLAIGSGSTMLHGGNVDLYTSKIAVSGHVSGEFGWSGSGDDRYERRMARRSFGPHAFITNNEDRGFRVEIREPSFKIVALAVFSAIWHVVALFGTLWALRAVLRETLKGDPFGDRAVRWMRWLAFGLLLAGPGSAIVSHLTTKEILHAIGGSGYGLAWHVSSLPILGAILVFALSEVWRYGNQLQREVEATV